MRAFPALTASTLLAMLAGCATSHSKWNVASKTGPYSAWMQCIDHESCKILDQNEPVKANGNRHQKFVTVVAACRFQMIGNDWDLMTDREVRKMMSSAQRHFFAVGAEINYKQNLETI